MIKTAKTIWEDSNGEQKGSIVIPGEGNFSFPIEFSCSYEHNSMSPENFLAAAYATCFSSMLINSLIEKGYRVNQLATEVEVQTDNKEGKINISRIDVCTEAAVMGISFAEFNKIAEKVNENCPLARILSQVDIVLHATLKIGIINEIIL